MEEHTRAVTLASEGPAAPEGYHDLFSKVAQLLEEGRRTVGRTMNSIMTATYWEIGRRIVEREQGGVVRAEYGDDLIARLSKDLRIRFGRGFSQRNVEQMRRFYLTWQIPQTLSAESQTSGHVEVTALQHPMSEVVLPVL